jgi:UMF1 family MFS transporter
LISGLAFALGNLGGVSLMLLVLFAFALPGTVSLTWIADAPWLGIDQATHQQDRIVGPIAAVWLLLFTLPVLLFTPDGKRSELSIREAASSGVAEVWQTLRKLKNYMNVARYLLARMFFNDGMVGVLIFGGIYASGVFGWDSSELLIFGLCTSTSAMLGAYFGGRFDDLLGSKRTLMIAVCASAVIFLFMLSIAPGQILFALNIATEPVWSLPFFNTSAELLYFATNQIFAVFFVTGLSTSRTLMARISPPAMSAQFFALYGLSGSVTAFLAPLLVATTTDVFDSARIGMSALVVLIVIGVWLLAGVKEAPAGSS